MRMVMLMTATTAAAEAAMMIIVAVFDGIDDDGSDQASANHSCKHEGSPST